MKKSHKPGLWLAVILLSFLPMLFVSYAMAEPTQQDAEVLKVREGINKILKSGNISSITPAEVSGLYEVMVGPQLFYVSADGKYLLSGKLFDLDSREDLTSPKVSRAKAQAIEAVGEDNMVIFAPEKFQHTVTIFTDIDCGYCQKLHSEIDDYNELGIRVRYLMFPRAGIGSDSYDKAVTVLCADDRKDAMTRSKAGEKLAKKECENPVNNHWNLGQLLGVNGTPAVFLESGDMLPGYMPAKRMNTILEEMKKLETSQSAKK